MSCHIVNLLFLLKSVHYNRELVQKRLHRLGIPIQLFYHPIVMADFLVAVFVFLPLLDDVCDFLAKNVSSFLEVADFGLVKEL